MRRTKDHASGYATDITRLLWPAPWTLPRLSRRPPHCGPHDREWYVFPSAGRARLLVPADVPAAADMVQRLGKRRTTTAGWGRNLAVSAVRSPAFAAAPWAHLSVSRLHPCDEDSVEAHLAERLGLEIRVGVLLGTRRANEKPVLQIFALDGRTLGFAKVGHNDLTAALVRAEARALTLLDKHRTLAFDAPRPLHHGQWRGLEILALSPLSGTTTRHPPDDLLVRAMLEVARLRGTTSRPLVESPFWKRLRAQVAEVPDTQVRRRLESSLMTVDSRWGQDCVEFGAWHGDWGHWNMAVGQGRALVWDWERYDEEVPVGFDALHFGAQRVRPLDRGRDGQEQAFLRSVPGTLERFGVPRELTPLTLVLYLVEVGVRYALADDYASGTALGVRGQWTTDLVARLLAAPEALAADVSASGTGTT